MHAVLDSMRTYFDRFLSWVHPYFDRLLHSQYHWMAYAAGAAVLLICIPVVRAIFRGRRRDEGDIPSTTPYASVLGLTSASVAPLESRRAAWESAPPAPVAPVVSNVTAINEALTTPCIHCGVTISSREDFCPACGYAQPVKQSFIAAFPA
jgi:hypothetical protein